MKRANSTQSSTGSYGSYGYGGRPSGGGGGAGGGGGYQQQQQNYKKPRNEDGLTFEEELGMMDDAIMAEQRVEGGEDVSKVEADMKAKWIRSQLGPWDAKSRCLRFHWLDIDMKSGQPLLENPDGSDKVPGSSEGPVPIIRMYGVNEDGHSVMCNVHGVTPYFYAQFAGVNDISDETIAALRVAMDQKVRHLDRHFGMCNPSCLAKRFSQSVAPALSRK